MIKNLKESIKMLTEESLADRLENEMGIDPTQASDAVKELGFTEYLEVAAALEDGDQTRVRELLGLGLEEDYTKAKVTDVRPGQEVTYQDDKGRETTVDLRDPDHELGLAVLDMSGNRPATDERGEDVTPNAKEIERGDEFMIDLEEGIDWPEDLDYEAEAYNAIRHYSYASDAYDYLFGAFYPNVQWIRDNEEALLKLFTDHGLKGSSDGLDEMKKLAGLTESARVRVYSGYGPTGGQMPFISVNGRDIAFKIEDRLHDADISSDGKGDMSVEDVTEILRERGVSEEDIKDAMSKLGMSVKESQERTGEAKFAYEQGVKDAKAGKPRANASDVYGPYNGDYGAGYSSVSEDEDCETCGGWGEVSTEGKHWRDTEFFDPTRPCPDCSAVEETTAGAVASVAMPMGKMIKRKK